MLHRQLTDEMNLELEQRRKDSEQRSRQLEDQSRCEMRPNGNVWMLPAYTHLLSVLLQGNCRTQSPARKPDRPKCKLAERAARRTAKGCCYLTGKLDTMQHCKAHRSIYSHWCYRCILPHWTQCSSLMTQLVLLVCRAYSVVNASHAGLRHQQ